MARQTPFMMYFTFPMQQLCYKFYHHGQACGNGSMAGEKGEGCGDAVYLQESYAHDEAVESPQPIRPRSKALPR